MTEFVELLKGIPFGDIGFAGLVTLAIVLIFRGDIIPRSSVEALLNGKDTMIAAAQKEAETWREAFEVSEQARATSAAADNELLELGRTTAHLLKSIHERAQGVDSP